MGYTFGTPPDVIPLGGALPGDVDPTRHYMMRIKNLSLYPSRQTVDHRRVSEPKKTPGSSNAAQELFKGDFGNIAKPGWDEAPSNFDIDFKDAFSHAGPTLVLIWIQAPHFQFAAGTNRAITAAEQQAADRMYEPKIFMIGNRRRIASFIVRPKPAGVPLEEYLDFNICVTAPPGPGSGEVDFFIDPKVRNDG
jgi:hypothetical protein